MSVRPQKPALRPLRPHFSSGPCVKRPGWTPAVLQSALHGRSHRSTDGRARLQKLLIEMRELLALPDDYLLAIMPASDTGAFEAALWSMLGTRGIDVLAWESFGQLWRTDILQHLKLTDVRVFEAPYGDLPDLAAVDFSRDTVLTWNGTTSGVRVPNSAWIAADRGGLMFVDATSAVLAEPIEWRKTDVVTFSWQKALGSEAAHGMLVLSPRAVARLESYSPPWPMPKLFRLTRSGQLDRALFEGWTINTPSMLCVEDCLDALAWARSEGGGPGLVRRARSNAAVVFDWIDRTPWIANLARDPATRSHTSVCLVFADPDIGQRPEAEQRRLATRIAGVLAAEGAALDILAHRDAPPGLRIWTGPTVEREDLMRLMPWLDWAYQAARAEII